MAWLFKNDWVANPRPPTALDLDNIGKDMRTWGGAVDAGGYNLSNVGNLAFAASKYIQDSLYLYGAAACDLKIQYGGSQLWWITADENTILKIGGASGTRPAKGVINITSTGCVGINSKTNLLYPLEVRDAARIQGTVPVLYFGVGTDGAAVNKWHFAVEGADSDFTLTQSGIAAWVRVQKTTGNVCIGANQVADYKLVVKTEWGGGVIRIGAEGAWMGRIKCDTHLALETPADAGDILMLAGGTEVMRVACANKSVSIGTPGVGPVARLTLMTDDPRVMYLYRQAGVGSGWGIYSDANGNLDFTYENADKTRVGGRYRFTYDGCMIIPVANAAPADAHFEAGNQQVGLYYDTANKRLSFKLREAGGAFRTGYVQLA